MLKHLAISDYTIVDHLTIELGPGMTVITGETGAGKSIMLDALALCLGDRADPKAVKVGAQRAEITAEFDISQLPAARQWLEDYELDRDGSCILRRSINADGRSRAFINGSPSTLSDCAALGQLLVDIHSQHAHQSLLRPAIQSQLLDAYAQSTELAAQVRQQARQWRTLKEDFERRQNQDESLRARYELLVYQVEELDRLSVDDGEVSRLESEQQQLSHARYIIESAAQAAEACDQQCDQLRGIRGLIDDERHAAGSIANVRELLTSAEIQLNEARSELSQYAESVEINPERLAEVEDRLGSIYDLARKHRVQPERLPEHHTSLREELRALDGGDEQLATLAAELEDNRRRWQNNARQLSTARRDAAKQLIQRTHDLLSQLAMERCRFDVVLNPNNHEDPEPYGAEKIEFRVSTNPGASPAPLAKVASGGELSRISLALQVAAAEIATSPTMVFDEIDVGIGGGTAENVGALLRQLAARVQVICVTHQPQVAAKGQHHLQVHKTGDQHSVVAGLTVLDQKARVAELARMLGGVEITANTRRHAKEMLERA